MFACPSCATTLAEDTPFCPHCGRALGPVDQLQTQAPRPSTTTTSSGSGNAAVAGSFAPGAMLLGRYRVVAPLGKGGMGEVYRADDLKLGQPVALKFLPERALDDPAAEERLLGEVRTARQVAHPNVCRVYDAAEAGGRHFISMELIDGEDLQSLLRRIGRLPSDKALQIARQLCAGLAAAHDRGILHRDLKPANVMLDGRGHVRITDFGLAGLVDEVRDQATRAGTPSYMAPEQLTEGTVDERSDIYALGLVLYEVFTGKRAHDAESLAELLALHRGGSSVTTPSSVLPDIDPAIESVILRCLERDPARRPQAALKVSAALPGGDPIDVFVQGIVLDPGAPLGVAATTGVRASLFRPR